MNAYMHAYMYTYLDTFIHDTDRQPESDAHIYDKNRAREREKARKRDRDTVMSLTLVFSPVSPSPTHSFCSLFHHLS